MSASLPSSSVLAARSSQHPNKGGIQKTPPSLRLLSSARVISTLYAVVAITCHGPSIVIKTVGRLRAPPAAALLHRPSYRPSSSTAGILPGANAFSTAAAFPTVGARQSAADRPSRAANTRLHSLKPAAIPLMDSGKALARSGELLIDLTTALDIYGGSLSATGANIRNCGDCLAQAAASCRFKTAAELVIDELREGADCLREGCDKLPLAIEESEVDGDKQLMERIDGMIAPLRQAAISLEKAGASIMQRESVGVVGRHLIACGESLELLSARVGMLDPSNGDAALSSQRMMYASEQMIVAGKELTGETEEKPKGKSWIKG